MLPENEQESPVATLLEDLGIGEEEPTQEIDGDSEVKEDLNLSDSTEDSTSNRDENNSEAEENTETSNDDTSKYSELEAKLTELTKQQETYEKRLSDKDKYINELKNGKTKNSEDESVEAEESDNLDFWDDPEGLIKKLQAQIAETNEATRIANLRVDESYYAQARPDYLDLVNQDNLIKAFGEDKEFESAFKNSAKPYEVAYEYLKNKQTNKTKQETDYRSQIEKEILAKYGLDKKNKEAIPSVNKVGSSTTGRAKAEPEDGFASVFGGM